MMTTGLKIAIIVGAVAAILAIVGLVFWRMMGQPMYTPGMVSAEENLRAPLTPPADQPDDGQWWAVEEDVQLWHFSQGAGRNVLIVHGGPGYPYREPWSGFEPLVNGFQFHYYDQRGCGQSTRPIDTLTAQNNYQNIQTLEQTLGIGAQLADMERIRQLVGEERLILVGHSFGGFQAALYAAEFPENVEALVLVSPADVLIMPSGRDGLFGAVRERLPAEMLDDYDAYIDEYLGFQGLFDKSEAELATFNADFGTYYAAAFDLPAGEQGEPGGWMVQAQYFSMGRRHDYRDALADVTAPVLVVHSANDIQPEAVGQMYVDALPNAQLVTIQNASHFAFEEQPEAFASVVGDFLSEFN